MKRATPYGGTVQIRPRAAGWRKTFVPPASAVFDSPVGVTPAQFEKMKARVAGARRVAGPVLPAAPRAPARGPLVILGIDPSLRGTGWGIIRTNRTGPVALAHGTVTCPPAWEHSRCLVKIAAAIRDAIREHHPTVCVVEGLFFAQNLRTAIVMGAARGASLVAAGEAGLEIFEIAPRKVKQAIVGYGAAQKLAVAKMVQRLLRLTEIPAADAADALALALAHAQETSRYSFSPPRRI